MLTAYVDIGVARVIRRSTVNEPRIPMPPVSSGRLAEARLPGRDAGECSGTDPDVDELELLYPRAGRHLGEPGRGEHSMDGGFEALVVEALPVLL